MTLAAADLSFAYPSAPNRPVISSLSAAFAPGFTCVIGPNAAGKSTLLRLLLGALRPTAGRVTLDLDARPRDVATLPPRTLARAMAYIPQSSTLAAPFSLRQVVSLARHAFPAPLGPRGTEAPHRAIVNSVLDRLELLDLAHEPFHRLSAGQQQRGRLARAVAQLSSAPAPPPTPTPADDFHRDIAPKLLLADEPTSSMDPRHAIASLTLLRELADAGCTVIAVLHDLSLCLRFATRVLALSARGRLCAFDAPARVLTPEILRSLFSTEFRVIPVPGGASDGDGVCAVVAAPPAGSPVPDPPIPGSRPGALYN